MKAAAFSALMLVALAAFSQATHGNTTAPKVPDAETAIGKAEKVLSSIYGKKQIESERPFTASLSNGVWHVAGTLHCKDRHGRPTNMCLGGRVLRTTHTM